MASSSDDDEITIRALDTVPIGKDYIELDSLPSVVEYQESVGIVHVMGLSVQRVHAQPSPNDFTECPRAVVTPEGDYLLMFPAGEGHYHGEGDEKVNDMVAYRSSDGGQSWDGPTVPWEVPYNQHAFIPLIPNGADRIYAFGTEPVFDEYDVSDPADQENAPIAYRYSDDDGYTWSEPTFIRPENNPDFGGMSAMDMCKTDDGTWLLGCHQADWSADPLQTRQFILRSDDRGESWEVIPGGEWEHGWYYSEFGRMDEGRPIALGNGRVLLLVRTPEGHLWELRSDDHGRTWGRPEPTSLVHPDAPPTIEMLADNETLVALHHNRHTGEHFSRKDRGELWISLSHDDGQTWEAPRYLLSNAAEPYERFGSPQYRVSYPDLVVDGEDLHIFIDHQTRQVLHVHLTEKQLEDLPTKDDIPI